MELCVVNIVVNDFTCWDQIGCCPELHGKILSCLSVNLWDRIIPHGGQKQILNVHICISYPFTYLS